MSSKANLRKFTNVAFRDEHPGKRVADHEVSMAFLADDDAAEFRAWWEEVGSAHFAAWLDKQEHRKPG